MAHRAPLSPARIFWFWVPLAAMWLMMAVEQPAVSAVIARLPAPQLNLAAFGITFSLALFVEGPVIMLLTAGTALPKDRHSYRRLLHFTHGLAACLTGLHLLIGVTPLYELIVVTLIGAPRELLELSRHAFLLLLPWTGAIAYRRLWQGILIRYDRTGVVPLTIAARLVVTSLVLGVGLLTGLAAGALMAAAALSLGVLAAALVAYLFARPTIRRHLHVDVAGPPLAWDELFRFYLPLSLTSLIVIAAQPILAAGLARAAEPLASLAVWPVIMSFLFLGRSMAISYQEAVVALLTDDQSAVQLRCFTQHLAAWLAGGLLLVAATPLAQLWYLHVAGLPPSLLRLTILPTLILALVPALTGLISWQRGQLICQRRTGAITRSVLLHLAVLVATVGLLTALTPLAGATCAAIALAAAITAEWLYLARSLASLPAAQVG